MKHLLFYSFFILVVFIANAQKVVTPHAGEKGSWKLLGTVQASHNADHDAITVKGPYDSFRKLKFKVTESPLNITKIIVRYDDGGLPENIETRLEIPKGGESRVIDLKGGKRKIKSVEFWYETRGFLNGKANLTLFGMK
jgi:hypothetical protein